MSENIENKMLFNLVQNLGTPSLIPPIIQGKLSTSLQFIIPGLKIGKRDKDKVTMIAKKCGRELYGVIIHESRNERTKEPATLVEMAFYINPSKTEEEMNTVLESTSRLLAERFLGLLSFFLGKKLSAINIQYNTTDDGKSIKKTLPVSSKSPSSSTKVILPEIIENFKELPEDVFSAIFWLRRGLAERDPIENFSSLMVCLQIMAKHLIPENITTRTCPACGVALETQPLSITQKVHELLTNKLGATNELSQRLWKTRNAIVAHGNKPVTAEVFLELTDLKFDAINLVYNSIKLALGIPFDSPPYPDQAYFATDAFMYVD